MENIKKETVDGFINQIEKTKTLANIMRTPKEFYSVLIILNGHIDRQVVMVKNATQAITSVSGCMVELDVCLDPILLPKEDAERYLIFHEANILNIVNFTTDSKIKQEDLKMALNMEKFIDKYLAK